MAFVRIIQVLDKCKNPKCKHPEAPHKAQGYCTFCYNVRYITKVRKKAKKRKAQAVDM